MNHRDVMQQALDALLRVRANGEYIPGSERDAIRALRNEIAKPAAVTADWVMVPRESLERWRAAFAEELSAWDIEPPIHHVKQSYDEIQTMLAAVKDQP